MCSRILLIGAPPGARNLNVAAGLEQGMVGKQRNETTAGRATKLPANPSNDLNLLTNIYITAQSLDNTWMLKRPHLKRFVLLHCDQWPFGRKIFCASWADNCVSCVIVSGGVLHEKKGEGKRNAKKRG